MGLDHGGHRERVAGHDEGDLTDGTSWKHRHSGR